MRENGLDELVLDVNAGKPFPPARRRASTWSLSRHYLRPHRRAVVVLSVLIVADTAFWTCSPLIAAQFVEGVAGSAEAGRLVFLAYSFLALGVLNEVVALASGRMAVNLAQRTTNEAFPT
ncbi:hypothetical protein [Nonomuraea wenchangensis]|uniref:hypothetical protein n=1 Tax=Nonomuraea wenchangensis TaxID=568860 RepID=UPI0033DCBC3C